METIAIIAISSGTDVPFVVTLQTVRFLTIVAIGTPIARFLVHHAVPSRAL